jgi:serine/threonine protein kinase
VATEQILKEVSTLSQLDHPHVIKLHASFVKGEDQLWMVMPLLAHGSVLDVIRDGGHPTGLPELCIGAILGPTLEALA